MNQWKKEQEMYSQMIHGELIELGETKILSNKLRDQVRVLTMLVKREQAKQENLNKELMMLPKIISEFQSQVAFSSMMIENKSPKAERAKTNHTQVRAKRPIHGLESRKRSDHTSTKMVITNTKASYDTA